MIVVSVFLLNVRDVSCLVVVSSHIGLESFVLTLMFPLLQARGINFKGVGAHDVLPKCFEISLLLENSLPSNYIEL